MNPSQDEFFDIQQYKQIFTGSYNEYMEFISSQYFKVCAGSRVLEIGPFEGAHSKKIISHQPEFLEVIEGFSKSIPVLNSISGIDSVIYDDVMLALNTPKKFDVVICLGVLYHLHSPIHLLELIVNYCDPECIILDCVIEQNNITLLNEALGMPGSCQVRSDWKSAKVNCVIPFLSYMDVMKNLGYELSLVDRLQVQEYTPKTNCWVAMWRKSKETI